MQFFYELFALATQARLIASFWAPGFLGLPRKVALSSFFGASVKVVAVRVVMTWLFFLLGHSSVAFVQGPM